MATEAITKSEPISRKSRPSRPLPPTASLQLAAWNLREQGAPFVAIAEAGAPLGLVDEASIADALARALPQQTACSEIMKPALVLPASTTVGDALKSLQEASGAIVVDEAGQYMGLLFPSDLINQRERPLKPPLIGGMATPNGVYLTAGMLQAGAKWWNLALSGCLLVGLMMVGRIGSVFAVQGLAMLAGPGVINAAAAEVLRSTLSLVFAAIGFRLLPIAGYHAAEHMVIHAVERDEDLTPAVVGRMPRVHKRCGTNLAAGAMMLGLTTADWGLPRDYLELQLVVGVVLTLLLWRKVGSLLQLWITTKKPSQQQIKKAIASAEELLEKYAHAPVQRLNFGQRIWRSGVIFTALAGMLTGWTVVFILYFCHHLDWLSP